MTVRLKPDEVLPVFLVECHWHGIVNRTDIRAASEKTEQFEAGQVQIQVQPGKVAPATGQSTAVN